MYVQKHTQLLSYFFIVPSCFIIHVSLISCIGMRFGMSDKNKYNPYMVLLHVALLTHRKIPCPLSFYSKDTIALGALLYVTLRKEKLLAVVVQVSTILEHKGDIRSQTFQLKKIRKEDVVAHIPEDILNLYLKAAELQAIPYSLLFDAIIPEGIKHDETYVYNALTYRHQSKGEKTISYLESSSEERIVQYKGLVRDILAKKRSIHIIAPTVERVLKLASYIGKGISHKIVILHGELSKKAFAEAVQKIYSEEEYICIFSTPHFAHVSSKALELTIVDQESHPNYYSFDTPSVDYCALFKSVWSGSTIKTLFADTVLRIESYRDLEEKKYPREFSIHSRFSHHIPIELCTFEKDAPFSTLTKPIVETLKKMKPASHAFLYVARKGVHTSIQCGDCGSVVLCSECAKPTTIQSLANNERGLRCLHCGHKEALSKEREIICVTCGSWKIKGYGVTTRIVAEELEALFPNKDVYVLDGDISEKTFKKTINSWKESGGILVGTDGVLPYLEHKLALGAIISCDSWVSMPDIDPHRRLIQVLEPLLEYSHNTVFVQTRIPDEPLFEICKKENITDYIKTELKERKELAHVPYTTFVLLRKDGSFSKKEADSLVELFPSSKPHIYKVHTDIRVLLRITRERFTSDTNLHRRLQGLYPHIIVEVNPQTLFGR